MTYNVVVKAIIDEKAWMCGKTNGKQGRTRLIRYLRTTGCCLFFKQIISRFMILLLLLLYVKYYWDE